MPQDEITDINEAVGQRWRRIDPLLPDPGDLPEGCRPPFIATAKNGRPAGLAVCRHQQIPPDSLAQTWSAAVKFTLNMRLSGPDTFAAADDLLGQWCSHLAEEPEAKADGTSATVIWPSRDITAVLALIRHGLQPITVVAARPARRTAQQHEAPKDLVIREAGPDDLDVVAELEMGVIGWDAHFGGSIPRPATPALVRAGAQAELDRSPAWTWLALKHGRPVGLLVVDPPKHAEWIAGMARPKTIAYLSTIFIKPGERGSGVGAQLVSHAHRVLDASGIDLTLLHYAQLNPLSVPFWHQMGYRPLWSAWEARPARTLR